VSALGQKQTSRDIRVMSALPQKQTFVVAIKMSTKGQKRTIRYSKLRCD